MAKKKITKNPKTDLYKKLVKSKGFYITLCSVAAITSFSIYSSHLRSKFNEKATAFDQSAWQETLIDSEVEVIDADNPQTEVKKPHQDPFDPPTVVTSAPVVQKTETPKFSMDFPLDGEIISPCSVDELVFCESMQDWRTHNGTDIAAKIGDPVKAAESGKVSQVYHDDLLGIVVEIDHGNQISSLYGNLQSLDFIKVGTEVKKGDIIGGVGDSGILEANSGPHLHFEIISNGEYHNPEEFITE